MIVNVINLPHRKDRLKHFINESKEQQFQYKVWDGIIDNIPATGISKAFKQIVKWAKDNNLPCVCIAEDDIKFCDKGAWNFYIKNIPTEYDLYLGSIYCGDLDNGIVNWFSGFTLVTIHERFYDKFLSTNEKNHIDRQMVLHKGIYKVCYPFAAIQLDGYSDNVGKVTNYNKKYLADRELFNSTKHSLQPLL